jgi:hypothetical protein
MEHPFNAVDYFVMSQYNPMHYTAIIHSVNAYLSQYDPVNILLVTLSVLSLTTILFPRVPYFITSLSILMTITESVRSYQQNSFDMRLELQLAYYLLLFITVFTYIYCVSKAVF